MIPGEIIPVEGDIELNVGCAVISLLVANSGDRPITNPALHFDRDKALGYRLDIAAGTAVRFEPGQLREIQLVPFSGLRRVYGFRQAIMGELKESV